MGHDLNYVELMIENVQKHQERLRHLSNDEIVEIISELKKESHVWDQIASGNRNYLEGVLNNPTDNYCQGAIPHLLQALAHRMGFIASKIHKDEEIGDPEFDEVISGKRQIMDLSDEKLVQFLRDFINSESIHKLLHKHRHNLRTIESIISKYDRLHAKDVDEAKHYLHSKKNSLYNLLVKSMLPNLMGAIARS